METANTSQRAISFTFSSTRQLPRKKPTCPRNFVPRERARPGPGAMTGREVIPKGLRVWGGLVPCPGRNWGSPGGGRTNVTVMHVSQYTELTSSARTGVWYLRQSELFLTMECLEGKCHMCNTPGCVCRGFQACEKLREMQTDGI